MFKTKPAPSSADQIQEKLHHSYEIRPFPRVVVKLIEALKDPDVKPREIAAIIESDAALCAKIMRMANSPMFGMANVIRTIEHATVVLGLSRLKSLAQTFAAAAMFASDNESTEIRKSIWDHSLACATTARLIASKIKSVNPDEAFLAGIFHDVGQLFFLDVVHEQYSRLIGSYSGSELVKQELEIFGISHQEAGVKLATAWKLPEPIMVAVGFHHQPENAIAHQDLAATICFANGLIRTAGIGSAPKPDHLDNDVAHKWLSLDSELVSFIQEQAEIDFAGACLAYGD